MKNSIFTFLLLFHTVLSAQDCVDPSLINPDAICPMIFAPVCGCDGITYDNSCYAINIGGVTSWAEGPCQQQSSCMDMSTLDFGLCDMFLGFAWNGSACVPISGCGYVIGNVDYSPNFYQSINVCSATCGYPATDCINGWQIEQGYTVDCITIDDPVCGCDNITYSNSCVAFFSGGVTTYSMGPCSEQNCSVIPDFVDFGDCDMALGWALMQSGCTQMSGCSYIGQNGYDYSAFFFSYEAACNAVCNQPEPESCEDMSAIDFGPCDQWLGYAWNGTSCSSMSGCGYIVGEIDYSGNFYTELTPCLNACANLETACINQWQIEQANLMDMQCPAIYEPVCGCNGITYSNSCEAFWYGGNSTFANGPCDDTLCFVIPNNVNFGACAMPLGWALTESGCIEMSGCSYIGQNGYDYSAYFFESSYQCGNQCVSEVIIDCVNPAQIDPNVFCIELYDPVCGCNNITYSNSCFATYAGGVTSWTSGPCITSVGNLDAYNTEVYPNPTNGLVQIQFSKAGAHSILMHDLSGRIILSQKSTGEKTQVDITALPAGLYMMTIGFENEIMIHRQIIKQ